MAGSIVIELEIPGDLKQFRLPKGVNHRLQELLDKQSESGKLSRAERQEAEGLVDLAEMLSLLRLRAARAARFGEQEADVNTADSPRRGRRLPFISTTLCRNRRAAKLRNIISRLLVFPVPSRKKLDNQGLTRAPANARISSILAAMIGPNTSAGTHSR